MKFEPQDYDWSDWHEGLLPRRRRRLEKITEAIINRLEEILKQHGGKRHIVAAVPTGIFATGVKGDRRVYAPIVMLFADRSPGYKRLQLISQAVTNGLPVSRVIFCLSHKVSGINRELAVIQPETKTTMQSWKR